jgi:hypothetical protein
VKSRRPTGCKRRKRNEDATQRTAAGQSGRLRKELQRDFERALAETKLPERSDYEVGESLSYQFTAGSDSLRVLLNFIRQGKRDFPRSKRRSIVGNNIGVRSERRLAPTAQL